MNDSLENKFSMALNFNQSSDIRDVKFNAKEVPQRVSKRRELLDSDVGDEMLSYNNIIDALKKLYKKKICALEERYKFDLFHSTQLRDSDFEARPIVLLLGQYSTGKTTFIEYLLGRPYSGERIGPEPTTDRFVAVMYGKQDRIIPGNALSVDAEKPFYALNNFGNAFLSKFEAAESTAPVLKKFTLIDTPGILSGEKQRIGRSYDFVKVCEWFSERSDLILLLFDCAKLDISDEFKRTIVSLRGHDDKIRVVLNKSDQVSNQQLMRIYGALMWSLGKVIPTPEVTRVYIGSFWDKPYANASSSSLFEAEENDLIKDLLELPRNSAVRKVNELVKRARLVKVHSYIVGHLRSKLPFFGKEKKKQNFINNINEEFKEVERVYRLPPGDFPDVNRFLIYFKTLDLSEMQKLNDSLMKQIEEVLSVDLPKIMSLVSPSKEIIYQKESPFSFASDSSEWEISFQKKSEYDAEFYQLNPTLSNPSDPYAKRYLTGAQVKKRLLDTGLPSSELRKIWELADIDKDNNLDDEEFALALYLCEKVSSGSTLPTKLGPTLIPPSKKQFFS